MLLGGAEKISPTSSVMMAIGLTPKSSTIPVVNKCGLWWIVVLVVVLWWRMLKPDAHDCKTSAIPTAILHLQ